MIERTETAPARPCRRCTLLVVRDRLVAQLDDPDMRPYACAAVARELRHTLAELAAIDADHRAGLLDDSPNESRSPWP